MPELDTLRFFAFFAVFLHHGFTEDVAHYAAKGVPTAVISLFKTVVDAGLWGVDLFFLLSSFLITSLLIREHDRTGKVDLKGFWIRRCLRIWPLYFAFVVVAGFILPRLFYFVPPPEHNHVLGLFSFTQNWAVALSGPGLGSPTLVLWSVSLEEQFYFTWPILIALCGMKRLRTIAIGMIVFSFIARIIAIYAGASTYMLWCATPFRLEPIAIGALIALCGNQTPAWTGKFRLALLLLGFATIALVSIKWTESPWFRALQHPIAAVGCMLIFLSVRGANWKWLTIKPLVYLGKISYGLYVFHQLAIYFSPRLAIPGLPFGRSIAAFALTIALAALSYRWLELPFLRLKDRFAHVKSRPA